MSNRAQIIDRLRKLRERTVENGCTEAEAMAAMAMIGKIMDEHNVAMSEIDVREEAMSCETGKMDLGSFSRTPDWAFAASAVADFTDTKVWRTMRAGSLNFFGTPVDVASAVALMMMIKIAVTHESARWSARNPGRGKAGAGSFRKGMVHRIQTRLRELKKPSVATGTALMVLKDQLVTEQFKKLPLNLTFSKSARYSRDRDAYEAGKDAGNRVTLTKTIGEPAQRRLA